MMVELYTSDFSYLKLEQEHHCKLFHFVFERRKDLFTKFLCKYIIWHLLINTELSIAQVIVIWIIWKVTT